MPSVKDNQRRRNIKSETVVIANPIEGRVPPQAIDVEEAVLGAILLEKDAYGMVSDVLKPEAFYVKAHETIYQAISALALRQAPIDMLTVSEELRKMGELETVGGDAYISSLTLKVAGAANLEHHAAILVSKSLSRELISFSSNVLKNAYDDTEDVDDQMQDAEAKLFEISQRNLKEEVRQINPIIKEAVAEIQIAANRETGISGLATGFPALDAMTSGWQNSDLIIIAARPAMGKTAFVLSMAKNMAVDLNIPVAIFNLEMSSVQLVKRLMTNVCEIPGEKIKSGRLEKHEWTQLDVRLKDLEDKPLYIDETPSLSVFELRTKARRLVREHGAKCLIIDYLQLMNASGMSIGNREQEVSTISRSLKVLAKELKIPVIALSQLNRSVETRQTTGEKNSRRPQLSDLRESGAIEQDADIVCFIHRPEYYKIMEDEQGNSLVGIAEFIIAKHRNGPIGDVRMSFRSQFAKFLPLEAEMVVIRESGIGTAPHSATLVDNTIASSIGHGGGAVSGTHMDPLSGEPPMSEADFLAGANDFPLPY